MAAAGLHAAAVRQDEVGAGAAHHGPDGVRRAGRHRLGRGGGDGLRHDAQRHSRELLRECDQRVLQPGAAAGRDRHRGDHFLAAPAGARLLEASGHQRVLHVRRHLFGQAQLVRQFKVGRQHGAHRRQCLRLGGFVADDAAHGHGGRPGRAEIH